MSDGVFVPERAMVCVAHPDDAEFMAAGTVAKWAGRGCEVTYVILTNGNKGSENREITPSELAVIREEEQRAAGTILGVKNFEFMGYEDGYLAHTLDLRRAVTRMIRRYRPEVVICFDPTSRFMFDRYPNHPDHRASGDATVDAIFPSARDHLTFPELLADGLEPHKVSQIWMGASSSPNHVEDIGETLELKQAALRAHPSQIDVESVEMVEQMARMIAKEEPFEHGESFRRIMMDAPFVEDERSESGGRS